MESAYFFAVVILAGVVFPALFCAAHWKLFSGGVLANFAWAGTYFLSVCAYSFCAVAAAVQFGYLPDNVALIPAAFSLVSASAPVLAFYALFRLLLRFNASGADSHYVGAYYRELPGVIGPYYLGASFPMGFLDFRNEKVEIGWRIFSFSRSQIFGVSDILRVESKRGIFGNYIKIYPKNGFCRMIKFIPLRGIYFEYILGGFEKMGVEVMRKVR